jgi:hypothetical protein
MVPVVALSRGPCRKDLPARSILRVGSPRRFFVLLQNRLSSRLSWSRSSPARSEPVGPSGPEHRGQSTQPLPPHSPQAWNWVSPPGPAVFFSPAPSHSSHAICLCPLHFGQCRIVLVGRQQFESDRKVSGDALEWPGYPPVLVGPVTTSPVTTSPVTTSLVNTSLMNRRGPEREKFAFLFSERRSSPYHVTRCLMWLGA